MIKQILKTIKIFLLAFTIGLIGLNTEGVLALEDVIFINELKEGLQEPIDSAVNSDGDVFVLDQKLCKVFVFGSDGSLKYSFGEQGEESGKFNKPQSIALNHNGDVVIADTGNSRIQILSSMGEFLYAVGAYGKEEGEFKSPDSLAVDESGHIYVGDSGNKAITKYSPLGHLVEHRKVNFKPKDLVFDQEENLYILMPTIGKIIKYDLESKDFDLITFRMEGENLISNAAGISVDQSGHIYLVETQSHSVKKIDQNKTLLLSYGSKGIGEGQFNWPSSITSDRTGRIYVADARNKRVQVLENAQTAREELRTVNPSPSLQTFENETQELNRIYMTKVSRPLDLVNAPDRIKYAISKKMILEEFKKELSFKFDLRSDALSNLIQVEAEEFLEDGQVKLTVSIPKQIPLETKAFLSKM